MSEPVILSGEDGEGSPSRRRRSFAPLRMTVYFFEIFAAANFLVIQALLRPIRAPLTMLPRALWIFGSGFLLQVAVGVASRAIIEWRRKQLAAYVTVIRSPRWVVDTLRLAVASALFVHAYGWIKLAVPLLHRRLFGQALWDLDAKLFAGHSPNEFFLA